MTETSDDENDVNLLARIAGGDVAAMRAIYLLHSDAVQRFVRTRIRNEFEIADITQETMMSVWRSASSFERRSTVRSWILSLARNKATDYLRKQSRVTLATVENPVPDLKSDDMTEVNVRHTELQTDSPDPSDTSNQLVDYLRSRSYERVSHSFVRPNGRRGLEKSKREEGRAGQAPKIHPDGLSFDVIQPALCAASPEFVEAFSRAPGTQWQRMSYAATAVLRPLGIHVSAWKDAVEMIGEERAALCVLVTDAKHRLPDDHPKHVRSPGGYLRMMSKKDRAGELNVERSIFGLAKADVLAAAS